MQVFVQQYFLRVDSFFWNNDRNKYFSRVCPRCGRSSNVYGWKLGHGLPGSVTRLGPESTTKRITGAQFSPIFGTPLLPSAEMISLLFPG